MFILVEELLCIVFEGRNLEIIYMDMFFIEEMFVCINCEDVKVVEVVKYVIFVIVKVVDVVILSFKKGGCLIYLGVGISG